MKTNSFFPCLILSLLVFSSNLFAQEHYEDGAMYLKYSDSTVKYFKAGSADSRKVLKKGSFFSLTSTNLNIYLYWLNPLRYHVDWKDSVYDDARDKAIKDFVDLLAGQFGTALTKPNTTEAKTANSKMFADMVIGGGAEKSMETKYGFDDEGLLSLLFHLKENPRDWVDAKKQLKDIFLEAHILDSLNSIEIVDTAKKYFNRLFLIDDDSFVKPAVVEVQNKIQDWGKLFDAVKKSQEKLAALSDNLEITKNPLLQAFAKKVISNFIQKVGDNTGKNKLIVTKLKPCLTIMLASVTEDSEATDLPEIEKRKSYFQSKTITFDDGKVLESKITITKYKLDTVSYDINKDNILFQSTVKFEKYDIFVPLVSTGIFYSSTSLNKFGLTPKDSSFIIKKDTIKSNTAITALFLNLYLNISRYVAPEIQLGVDPTKKYPFFLLGGGFIFPSAKFAITFGALWTWDASLNGKAVGDLVKSTTELEKATTYSFDFKAPEGWYMGLQYNF